VRNYLILLILLTGLLCLSCATIVHGVNQPVNFNSQPSGATVTIDGNKLDKTPCLLELERKNSHLVEITLEGYETKTIQIKKKLSGWVAGNILLGGLIGLAIDAITGAMYKLEPEFVSVELEKMSASADNSDLLYIMVVMEPQPDWQQIAQLEQKF
jgi:hypothetical protein